MSMWIASAVLSVGKLNQALGTWHHKIYYVVLALAVPALFGIPFALIERRSKGMVITRLVLGTLSIGICIPGLIVTQPQLETASWFASWRAAQYLMLVLAVFSSAAVVVWQWATGQAEASRRPARILAFATLFSLAPLVLLSILPQYLGASLYVPYEITMLGLAMIGFFYANLLSIRDLSIEMPFVYHFISLYLLITLFSVFFLAMADWLLRETIRPKTSWIVAAAVFMVAIILLHRPVYNQLARFVRWVWLGRAVRHDDEMERLISGLATVLDLERLNQIITRELAETLGVSAIWLLLNREEPSMRPIASNSRSIGRSAAVLPLEGALAGFLSQHPSVHSRDEIASAVEGATLSLQENELLRSEQVELWIPLVSADMLQGIVLMGPKRLGDHYSAQDRTFLATLAHQAAITTQNARLVAQVRNTQTALARAHREATAAGERESQRLAQELHDGAIQQLLDTNRQMGMLITPDTAPEMVTTVRDLQREVRDVVAQLRSYIGRLRPAGLDEMGLVPALLGYVASLRQTLDKVGPNILADMPEWVDLPEDDALCLFRIAQEAVRNAVHHAQAQTITVRLREWSHAVVLTVEDDGKGFAVPDRVTQLATENHFGVIIMAERAEQAGAEIDVSSIPDVGTRIRVRMPKRETESPTELPTSAAQRQDSE